MNKIKQNTILLDNDNRDLNKYKLVRKRDNLTKYSQSILWIKYKKNGYFKSKHKIIKVGRSLLMSPFNIFYTWQTTPVTEIIEKKKDYIKFKTENSVYELYKLNDK